MTSNGYSHDWSDIDTALYDRSVKLFRSVKNLLGVKINLYADSQPERGDIFLFNHFSRFETFIPQFLIYERTGAYSCAIASAEFFEEDTALARYLRKVGVFPHDHPRLFPMLAAQILRGRKVIIFPEGGMVKDRRVMDRQGHYSIYSRITGRRRGHHTGPAVLAQGLEAFKTAIRNAYTNKNYRLLAQWQEQLQIESLDQLLMRALKSTLIVPANITFYPIRSSENLLLKAIELFNDHLTARQMEEALIEGNILLKDTDMDVRMGTPIDPCMVWHWWNRYVLELFAADLTTLDGVFALHSSPGNLRRWLLGRYFRRCAAATRNHYMADIYENVTVNLAHLASSLIMYCVGEGRQQIGKELFYTTLYIAVKELQHSAKVNLHRSLTDPDEYADLIDGKSRRFEQFVFLAKEDGLIAEDEENYLFRPKLRDEYDFDEIRLENRIAVYSNEVDPIRCVRSTLVHALHGYTESADTYRDKLAAWRLEDEFSTLQWERKCYSDPRFDDINRAETADADPSPFFLRPEQPNGTGILLIHGLLAGPAEVKGYGDHLCELGYTVLGIRLQGHGTSPYALCDRSWEDWYKGVRRGFRILSLYCQRIVPVGFSTGGTLALKLASEGNPETVAVVALGVPVKFIDPGFALVPLLHETNRLIGWISNNGGIKPFIDNMPEHPRINYGRAPIRALYELRRLIQAMDEFLPAIDVPALVLYASGDPVVSVNSASRLVGKLGAGKAKFRIIPGNRHSFLMENLGDSWNIIDEFLGETRAYSAASAKRGTCSHLVPSNELIR